ncbi:MAG TPA: AI-2E family transporter [Thermoanaerobaculia bacterium]|jgi:predicted PurR-regulated permease PerM
MKAPQTTPAAGTRPRPSAAEIASWILAGVALLLILRLHLLSALLGGLAVYELVHILSARLRFIRGAQQTGKRWAVAILAVIVVAVLTLAVVGLLAFFRGHGAQAASLPALLGQMADILETYKGHLPAWVAAEIPDNADDLKNAGVTWLRVHAGELPTVGAQVGRGFLHALIGMVIGSLIALGEVAKAGSRGPLSEALAERSRKLGEAFRRIVFAQVRISALNTTLTALYLAVLLPLLGVKLPLVKTLIVLTFITGLLPVIGNLISNTVIVVVSMSYSASAALGALIFLVLIHKLEYFVNARIVGSEIKARAWELLLAMLVMEAAFGMAGLIAAPIYYAYLKEELAARGLI